MSYLEKIDATAEAGRWPLVRRLMREEPLAFYSELRKHRPVLSLSEVTLATRHSDCVDILARHDLFSVAPYVPKQGAYWMAQDDTARHWREKSVMRAVLDFEIVPAIRAWAEAETEKRIDKAKGCRIDAVAEITRGIPLGVVEKFFGITGACPGDLFEWSYWNQIDAFWNQPFDDPQFASPDVIVRRREAANVSMRDHLTKLVAERRANLANGLPANDMISRLLRLAETGALHFDLPLVVLNVGGLLIGTVETTSHAVANALVVLAQDDGRRLKAEQAARVDDPEAMDGYVYEALRFKPAVPYLFRRAEADTKLARGTDYETVVPKGKMVLAATHSAMFDHFAVDDPETFDPRRGLRGNFTFGYGLHECLGRAIGAALVPAIARAVMKRSDIRAEDVDFSNGPFPERWYWQVEA